MLTLALAGFLHAVSCPYPSSTSTPETPVGVVDRPAESTDRAGMVIPQPGAVIWAGGERDVVVEARERDGKTLYLSGHVLTDEALPDGYPRPTPPGVMEIKTYPEVRRAEVSGEGSMNRGSRRGFFPLFRHISRNNIAMTAPVEMDYESDGDDATGDFWTMSFLYRSPDNGPTGEDSGGVTVVDVPPVTVLSVGVMGRPGERGLAALHERLSAWLADNPGWIETDRRRWLGYNGPNIRWDRQWYEVQVVIEPASTASTEMLSGPGDDS